MQVQTPPLEESRSRAMLQPARLMSPEDVSSSLSSRPDEAGRLSGRWFLCGDVSDRFYELAKDRRELISFRVSAFHSPNHLSYGVITHQLEESQHRFVLPLFEARIATCLRQAMMQPLAFSLGHDASNQAVIQMPPNLASAVMPLLAMHLPLTRESALLALKEFPKVLGAACEFDQVATLLRGCEVREVSVSALFPEDAVAIALGEGPR